MGEAARRKETGAYPRKTVKGHDLATVDQAMNITLNAIGNLVGPEVAKMQARLTRIEQALGLEPMVFEAAPPMEQPAVPEMSVVN